MQRACIGRAGDLLQHHQPRAQRQLLPHLAQLAQRPPRLRPLRRQPARRRRRRPAARRRVGTVSRAVRRLGRLHHVAGRGGAAALRLHAEPAEPLRLLLLLDGADNLLDLLVHAALDRRRVGVRRPAQREQHLLGALLPAAREQPARRLGQQQQAWRVGSTRAVRRRAQARQGAVVVVGQLSPPALEGTCEGTGLGATLATWQPAGELQQGGHAPQPEHVPPAAKGLREASGDEAGRDLRERAYACGGS